MKSRTVLILTLVTVMVVVVTGLTLAERSKDDTGEGWMCPPCGHKDVDRVYSESGQCPICNMELIPMEERLQASEDRVRAAILLFDGVQIIDYTGPYEVFGQARFDVFTVSETGETITTAMDMSVNPTYSFESSPTPDLLLVPGGDVRAQLEDPDVLRWVQQMADKADHVLSVCNGAFILAEAGLLEGLTATTFHGLLNVFESSYEGVNVVRDQRFTDNGKIVTSAGLSSGIDASIHLVSKIQGHDAAQSLALHLEYEWNEGDGFVRGNLADRHLPSLDLDVPADTDFQELSSLGDLDRWQVRLAVSTSLDAIGLMNVYKKSIVEISSWEQQPNTGSISGTDAVWKIDTEDDGVWLATGTIAPDPNQDRLLVDFRLERADA